MDEREFHPLSGQVIGAAIKVHRALGPGLLESAYQHCLCHELALREIPFRRQVALPITYEGTVLDCGYRVDLVVAESLLVELKAVEALQRIHFAQAITYLRLGGFRAGLVINFNVTSLRGGGLRYLTPKSLPDLSSFL